MTKKRKLRKRIKKSSVVKLKSDDVFYSNLSSTNKLLAIDKTISDIKKNKSKNMCTTLALNLAYFNGETADVLKFDKKQIHGYIKMKLRSFSFTNASELFWAKKLKYGELWWDRYDIDSRIRFLNFLRDNENNYSYKQKTKSGKEIPEDMKLFKETKQNSLLSERAIKLIQKLEICTFEELLETPIELMLMHRNVGAKTISEIQKFIEVNTKKKGDE